MEKPDANSGSYVQPSELNHEVSREELYALVWSKPMLVIGKQFGVSSSYMARVCQHLNVPRPQRGYWAKVAAGKSPEKIPPLPPSIPGEARFWMRGALGFRSSEVDTSDAVGASVLSTNSRRHRLHHSLIEGMKPQYLNGKKSRNLGYLKPSKVLLPDVTATESGLDRALGVADRLFAELENQGHRVCIAQESDVFERAETDLREDPSATSLYENLWKPRRVTVVYVGSLAIGLSIWEMTEAVDAKYVNGAFVRLNEVSTARSTRKQFGRNADWIAKADFPTGRICIQAYCPYQTASWNRCWREVRGQSLLKGIPGIALEIESSAKEVAQLVAEGNRKREEEIRQFDENWARWEREAAEKRAAEAVERSRVALIEMIRDWGEASRFQAFFTDIETRLAQLDPGDREELEFRLRHARKLVGCTDALELFRNWKPLPQK